MSPQQRGACSIRLAGRDHPFVWNWWDRGGGQRDAQVAIEKQALASSWLAVCDQAAWLLREKMLSQPILRTGGTFEATTVLSSLMKAHFQALNPLGMKDNLGRRASVFPGVVVVKGKPKVLFQ